MPRATCRCGQALAVPDDPSERVVCPQCGARVRIRRKPRSLSGDGFIRFLCPCGRRLKVDASAPPPHGKCPDCGRVVPVPPETSAAAMPPGHPETPTAELSPADREAVARWAEGHRARSRGAAVAGEIPDTAPMPTLAFTEAIPERVELGMRICPNCGQPVHLGAAACRGCGTAVPRR